MRSLVALALVALLAWQGYVRYQRAQSAHDDEVAAEAWAPMPRVTEQPSASFKCDGRTHCSQMTSCAEATYFLKNCPGTQMDGNNDGIPCERQWCKP